MPIYQEGSSISDMLGQRKKAGDTITSILNKETKPRSRDVAGALTQNLMAVNDSNLYKPTTTQAAFEGRRAAEIAPQAALMDVIDGTIKAGGTETKAIMDTFGQFADNPEDLAKLVSAAHEAPEDITSANAATFAARKAQELGLQSAKKMQAQAQMNYSLNKGTKKEDKASAPTWLDSEQPRLVPSSEVTMGPDGLLLPPPESGSGASAPVSAPQTASVNGRNVDLSKFPSGVAAAKDYGDRKTIRSVAFDIIKGKDAQEVLQLSKGADKALVDLDSAEQALNNIVSKGGTTGVAQDVIGTWLNNPDFEILNKVRAGTAMTQRVPGTGAVSDFDARQLVAQVAGGDKSVPANRLMLATLKAQNQNAKQYGDYYRWYVNAFGTTDGLDSTWDEFRKANPMVGRDAKGNPVELPGAKANWEDYFSGKVRPATPQSSGTQASGAQKNLSDMTDEELDALERSLRGQ